MGMALISSSVMVPYGNYTVEYAQETIITSQKKKSKTYAHMDIPWWICHDDMELAQDRIIKSTQVAVNPLRWELHHEFHPLSKVANV